MSSIVISPIVAIVGVIILLLVFRKSIASIARTGEATAKICEEKALIKLAKQTEEMRKELPPELQELSTEELHKLLRKR